MSSAALHYCNINPESACFHKAWEADLQSLYAGDDGVERSLDVSRGAGADHWQMVVLQHV